MATLLFIITFLLLLFIGVPISFSMIVPSFLYLAITDVPISVVAQRLFDPMTSPTYLSIPFFILTAEIMNTTGVTDRIFNFARKVIGFIPGGLAQANILASMIFAGMSGSTTADASGLGRIEMKAMTDAKYDIEYSAGITAVSSVIGPIIPPSIPLAVYGVMAEQSIARMFIAGIIPGMCIGICMMVITYILAIKKPQLFPKEPVPSLKELAIAAWQGIIPLMLPIIIIGGLLSGLFTATEAGAIAVAYAIFSGLITKTFSLRTLYIGFRNSMRSTAMVMFMLGGAMVFSWVITISQLPQEMLKIMLSITSNKTIILIFISILIFIMGMFLAGNAIVVILAPILIEIAPSLNIDLVHLGVFLVLGSMIGVATPPVGGSLFVISDFTGLTISQVAKGAFPFLIATCIGWIIVTFIPETALFLPSIIWK